MKSANLLYPSPLLVKAREAKNNMDLNKLTIKSQEALQGAQQMSQNQQQNVVDVLHLLYILLGQQESIVPTIVDKLEIRPGKIEAKNIRRN